MKSIPILAPEPSQFYELLDSGNFEKLERFGKYITIRPEPQAVWDKSLSEKEWKALAHVKFVGISSHAGRWEKYKAIPEQWDSVYDSGTFKMVFSLALTGFKHVGVFPEQAVNWEYIYKAVKACKSKEPKVLNLFAYTGGASLAAKAAGADVTHVDSVKQVLGWSRRNMELSGLKDIRWVLEDAAKFTQRELKRGKKYNGIILDPPAFGHGPNGESWKLEKNINQMLKDVFELLDPEEHFLVLNTYSLGFSALIIENLVRQSAEKIGFPLKNFECGELYLPCKTSYPLPLGVISRFNNIFK